MSWVCEALDGYVIMNGKKRERDRVLSRSLSFLRTCFLRCFTERLALEDIVLGGRDNRNTQ